MLATRLDVALPTGRWIPGPGQCSHECWATPDRRPAFLGAQTGLMQAARWSGFAISPVSRCTECGLSSAVRNGGASRPFLATAGRDTVPNLMAKLVSAKCPHCGAPVKIPPDLEHVVCGYCHHSSSIQRGRPRPSPHHGPVIHVPPQRPWGPAAAVPAIVLGSLLVLGGVLGAVAKHPSLGLAGLRLDVHFSGQPFLFDVNGDGVTDLIGLSEYPAQSAWFAAYDGRDGKELWRTDTVTKEFAHMGFHALAGNLLVTTDNLGKVQTYQAKTGKPAWASLVSDEVNKMYLGDDFVRIHTRDNRFHFLSLATGQTLPDKSHIVASSIPQTRMHSGFGYYTADRIYFRNFGLTESIEGMRPERAVIPDKGKRALVLGAKSPGSSVPMIAAIEGDKVIWTSVVPAIDPLGTDTLSPTQMAALFGQRIAVPYRLKSSDGMRMAAFDTNTGKRLWDMPVHAKSASVSGIAMSGDSVFVATWRAIYVLRADTGELRFQIGKDL